MPSPDQTPPPEPRAAKKHLKQLTQELQRRTRRAKKAQSRRAGADPSGRSVLAVATVASLDLNQLATVTDPDPPQVGGRRLKILEWITMRNQGLSDQEIASRLGISPRTLNIYISRSVKEGWLKVEDPADRLLYDVAPDVVDNIHHFIKERDRTMTIEAAKGTGIFKSYQAIKTESETPTTMLALKIEMAPSTEIKQVTGTILGQPKFAEEEIVDALPQNRP